MAKVVKVWNGRAVNLAIKRASGRAIVGIAEVTSAETKQLTHVISRTLSRSVHAAPLGYDGSGDEALAETRDLGGRNVKATPHPGGMAVEVGSWIAYACAEWVGRGHPGITQGVELARLAADSIVKQAFVEEGLQ